MTLMLLVMKIRFLVLVRWLTLKRLQGVLIYVSLFGWMLLTACAKLLSLPTANLTVLGCAGADENENGRLCTVYGEVCSASYVNRFGWQVILGGCLGLRCSA